MPACRKVIDVITDLGEECDDEAACLWLYNLCTQNSMLIARVFFTNKIGILNFKQLLEGRKEIPNFHMFDFNAETFTPYEVDRLWPTLLVQISPIKSCHLDICQKYSTKAFDYILLGELGNSLNSNNDARVVATFLLSKADYGVCVATRGGQGAPNFTVADMEHLGGIESEIVKHIIKIGFRNSVGRAGAAGGKNVAHLVAAHEIGANYQTVVSIAKTLGIESKPDMWGEVAVAPCSRSSSNKMERQSNIMCIVKQYFEELLDHGLVVKSDRSTNAKGGVSVNEIQCGYAFIIDVLNQAFDVPIDFFSSQTPSRDWHKQWDFKKKSPHFKQTFSGIVDMQSRMLTAYAKFCTQVRDKNLELTPAYDVVAIAAALDYFNGTLSDRFQVVSEREIILKPDECGKGLSALFKPMQADIII